MRKITSRMSPTQLRHYRKMKALEEEEIIEKVGSETESEGRKATQELDKVKKEEDKKREEDALNFLDMNRRKLLAYREILQEALHQLILNIGMPITYRWGVWYDGKGIILAIRDKFNKLHVRAFKPNLDPQIDRNAVKTLALWGEDVYDKCEGNLASNIWTPPKQKIN